ncbi:MAG: stage II sporulation protein D [Firmicutes bacterium]|nr:stage II sporulation protein D [Bacillota bacterium]
MYRIKLMILWGLLFSIWLCKSLFLSSYAEESRTVCAEAFFTEYTFFTETEQTSTEIPAEMTSYEALETPVSGISLPYDAESYAAGVVAAEMPVYFPAEALKAQAVAARTYACREYIQCGNTDFHAMGQAYLSKDELKARWGADFEKNYAKILSAVNETAGEILIYDSEPILAAFCSASGGKTESSADAWGGELPYLQSVESPYDINAPVYLQEKRISDTSLAAVLGISTAEDIKVTKRSAAGYVQNLEAGGKQFSGDEIRRLLKLNSNDFEVRRENGETVFTVYGYGHGVGMSQYGAMYMAENGSSYRDILYHYYTGAEIGKIK